MTAIAACADELRSAIAQEIEPRRTLLLALATGLALGPLAGPPVLVLLLASIAALLVALRAAPLLVVLALTAVVVGAAVGDWRAGQLGQSRLKVPAAATGQATVLELPRENDDGQGRRALALWQGETVLLRASSWPDGIDVGAIVAVGGRLKPPDRGARARRAQATLNASSIVASGRSRSGFYGLIDGIRNRASRALQRDRDSETGALLTGMVLGQDGAMSAQARSAMRAASLSHLTAASGQNIALLATLAAAAGIAFGFGVRARWLLALVLIVIYVPLAGGGPSIVRAAIMGTVTIICALAGRPGSRADALALAAALTLLLDPRSVADLGWQLSFAAVLGIALLTGSIERLLTAGRLPSAVATVIAVTAAATIATAPVIAIRTGQSSLLALPANIAVAAAVAPVMWLGMLASFIGQISFAAAAPIAAVAAVPAAFIGSVGGSFGRSALADTSVPAVVVTTICAATVVVLLVLGRRYESSVKRRAGPHGRILIACALTAVVATLLSAVNLRSGAAPPVASDALRITGIAIGQGDATLIEAGGRTILIDTGPPPAGRLLAGLRRAGVRSLDLLVLTHAQLDHMGVAPELLRRMPVKAVLDGRDGVRSGLTRAIGAALASTRPRPQVIVPRSGQRLTIGPIRADVLWPPAQAPEPGADPNDRAIVLAIAAYGRRALMTADAESDVLLRLPLRAVDVLKVSHHGSSDEGLPPLLARLRPQVALIEVGPNSYGHPTGETLAALKAARVPLVARTDRDGSVRIELAADGTRVTRGL